MSISAEAFLAAHTLAHQLTVLAESSSSSDDDSPAGLLLLPFVLAGLFYVGVIRRYRNHDKRYRYEQQPTVTVDQMMRSQVKVRSFSTKDGNPFERTVNGRAPDGASGLWASIRAAQR